MAVPPRGWRYELCRYRSAFAKFGALTGQTQSSAALSQKYGSRIREMAKLGSLPIPARATPGREVLDRAVALLKAWDARHFTRTDEIRVYHLAARLQLETTARSVSATERVTAASLRGGNQTQLVAKGEQAADLHPLLLTGRSGCTRTGNPGQLVNRICTAIYR